MGQAEPLGRRFRIDAAWSDGASPSVAVLLYPESLIVTLGRESVRQGRGVTFPTTPWLDDPAGGFGRVGT
jgi:hypothetical protein